MPHSTQRRNRAFKIAYLADIQRIIYSVTLSAFVHSWALVVISKLIPSAYTVLQFLAALHRCGKYGYIGCAIAYDLLAPQIVLATGRKCSVRTLKRGLAFLRAFGLVELRPWTIPDSRIRIGDRTVIVKGTARIDLGFDQWCTRQLRIVILTTPCLALWDKATKSQGDRYIPHYATCAKMAPNPKIDWVGKPTTIELKSSEHSKPLVSRKSVFDSVPTSDPDPEPYTSNGEKGRSTCPGAPVTACPEPRTFEHEASTPNTQDPKTQTPLNTGGALKEAPVFGQEQTKPQRLGCSRPRPQVPRRAPHTWTVGCTYILCELHRALDKFSTRQADSIFDRAKWELSRNYPAGWPTSCDWAYWVGRYQKFEPAQRRYHMLRDILPLLKTPGPITPQEPVYYRQWTKSQEHDPVSTRSPLSKDEGLGGLLERLWEKFCGED